MLALATAGSGFCFSLGRYLRLPVWRLLVVLRGVRLLVVLRGARLLVVQRCVRLLVVLRGVRLLVILRCVRGGLLVVLRAILRCVRGVVFISRRHRLARRFPRGGLCAANLVAPPSPTLVLQVRTSATTSATLQVKRLQRCK